MRLRLDYLKSNTSDKAKWLTSAPYIRDFAYTLPQMDARYQEI